MSKHDTWAYLKPESPFEGVAHLFPHGFPMRDPFPMGLSQDGEVALWFVDMDRLSSEQLSAIAGVIAQKYDVTVEQIQAESSPNGFAISSAWIGDVWGGDESTARLIEAAELIEAYDPPDKEAYESFMEQQYRDWIDGDRSLTLDEESEAELDLGTCCVCRGTENVVNLVNLPYKAPVPGTGWGNIRLGMKPDGAVAVVCDRCISDFGISDLQDVIYGYAADKERRPFSELAN